MIKVMVKQTPVFEVRCDSCGELWETFDTREEAEKFEDNRRKLQCPTYRIHCSKCLGNLLKLKEEQDVLITVAQVIPNYCPACGHAMGFASTECPKCHFVFTIMSCRKEQ